MMDAIMGGIVAIIMIIVVALPLTISVIGTLNLTGYPTTQTIVNILPVFIAIAALTVSTGFLALGSRR